MRKRTRLYLALGGALTLLTAGALLPRAHSAEVPEAAAPESTYVLREYDGRIAVYCGRHAEPAAVTDIEVRLLPEPDRQALSRGIGAEDPRSLCMLLEDLGS